MVREAVAVACSFYAAQGSPWTVVNGSTWQIRAARREVHIISLWIRKSYESVLLTYKLGALSADIINDVLYGSLSNVPQPHHY
jgi:hypothetical protein